MTAIAYAEQTAQRWLAYWDHEQDRQQQKIRLEQARECWQCHGTTTGSAIAWICDTCRTARLHKPPARH